MESRPLGHHESILYDFKDVEGGFTIVYSLTLSTNSELSDSVVVKSLKSWARIFPMLRMRVEEKDGVRYFREIENMNVDFERVDGDDWVKVYNALLNKTFNEAGPLWRVRLVDQGQAEGELKPYKYVMLLNWHHAITDGTTNIRMCNRLAEVVNSALGNETVEYGQEVEVKPPMEELLPQREYTWNEVKPLFAEVMQLLNDKEGTLWGQVTPGNLEIPSKSLFVTLDNSTLDEETTTKLIKRCKAEGATVNGALNTAVNVALYDALKSAGADDETLTIVASNQVSMRRFLEDKDVAGFTVGNAFLPFQVDSQTKVNFWQSAKEATKMSHDMFNAEDFIKSMLTVYTVLDGKSLVASMEHSTTTTGEYGFSNMGNTSREFPGEYENVSVEWLSRSTSICQFGSPFMLNATTFRGKLLLSATCDTRFCSEEKARDILNSTIVNLKLVLV